MDIGFEIGVTTGIGIIDQDEKRALRTTKVGLRNGSRSENISRMSSRCERASKVNTEGKVRDE